MQITRKILGHQTGEIRGKFTKTLSMTSKDTDRRMLSSS